jgi:hypothetical protein
MRGSRPVSTQVLGRRGFEEMRSDGLGVGNGTVMRMEGSLILTPPNKKWSDLLNASLGLCADMIL